MLALNSLGRRAGAEARPAGSIARHLPLLADVLRAVRGGRIEFAVDQQPYLQGYLPIEFLAERARYGLFPRRAT